MNEKKTRISLDLSPTAFERVCALEALTEANSKADVIREALRLYAYLVNQSLHGSRVQCVSPEGTATEVLIKVG